MGKLKIYDLAKELGLTSKEVIEIAQKLDIDAKSHLSAVDAEQAKRIRENAKKKTNKKEEKNTTAEKAERNTSPVIIRREVITNDDV